MRTSLLFALLFICSNGLCQNHFSIGGTVLNDENNQALSEVFVYLDKEQRTTVTDGSGEFELTNLQPGEYKLIVSNIGFKTIEKDIRISNASLNGLVFRMEETLYDLPQILIESISLTGGYSGIDDLHGSANFISKKELVKFNYSDVHQVLKSVPGVQIQEEDGFGLRPNIGIRGTSTERSAKITLMEDGILIAPAPYSAPSAYYFPTIARMDGIEILKGSSQIKHGPYTTGGALNLLSKQIPVRKEANLDFSLGSYRNHKIEASYGHRISNVGFLIQGLNYGSNGFKELETNENTGFNKSDILAKFNINSGEKGNQYHSLTFKFNYNKEQSNETYLGLSDDDFEDQPLIRYPASQVDQMNAHHQTYALSYTTELSPSFQINSTAYYNYFHRNWYKLDKVTDLDGEKQSISKILDKPGDYPFAYEVIRGANSNADDLYLKANNRNYRSAGLQTIAHLFFGREKAQKLNLGFRFHYDEMDRFQWLDQYEMNDGKMNLIREGTPGTESNRLQSAYAFASFARLDLKWAKWKINPGIRLESMILRREDFGKDDPERTGLNLSTRENREVVLIPGISFNYQWSSQLNSFGGVHKGFSPPSTRPESSPESSVNYELGTRFQNQRLETQLVAFFTDYSNLLGSDVSAGGGAGNDELFNGGAVDIRGLEFQIDYSFSNVFSSNIQAPISISYAYSDARFKSTFESELEIWGDVTAGDRLPYLAEHQMTIYAGMESQKVGINVQAHYNSPMLSRAGNEYTDEQYKLDSGFRIDLGIQYHIRRNIKLYFNALNLSNHITRIARHPAGLRPSAPRMISLGFRWQW